MTRARRLLFVAIAMLPCAIMPVGAQASDSVPVINITAGTPVRLVARDTSRTIVGRFSWQTGDTLVVHRAAGARDTTVLLRNLVRIDEQVRPFSTPATRRGALIGGVAGLVGGVLIVQKAHHDCDPNAPPAPDHTSSCEVNYFNVLQYTLVGAASVGWGIGWLTDERRWQVRWSAPLP